MIRQFIIFTQKEFYHIFRDSWTMLMLLAMPIMMIILFGFGISTEIKNTRYAVFDPSRDVASQAIVDRLSNNEYFEFIGYLKNPEEIEGVFRQGKVGLLVIFDQNFNENIIRYGDAQVQLIADGTDPNTAYTIVNYATGVIRGYQKELMATSGNSSQPFSIVPEVKLLYNPTMEGAYNTVPGVIGMVLLMICAMMTSVSIAREKELGTMEVILVSPMPPILIVLSKVVPYFVISVVNLLSVLLLAVFVLGVPINGSLFLLGGVSLLYIFVALALGLLISTLTDKQLVALLASAMGLMLPVILLSGLMFPIENMPLPLQGIAQIIPAKWFIVALRNIMIKGTGIETILPEIGVLSLMAVVLIGISVKRFKIRLE